MTKKDKYTKLLEEHEIYNGYDFLTQEEVADMRQEVKERVKEGATLLEGANNKATFRHTEKGIVLTSYYTDVVRIKTDYFTNAPHVKMTVQKLWHGYSATTLRHINTFLKLYNCPQLSKKEWIELPTVY